MNQKHPFLIGIAFTALLIVVAVFVVVKAPRRNVPDPLAIDKDLPNRGTEPVDLSLQYELDAQLESGLQGLRGIAVDANDNLYLAGANALKVIGIDGSLIRDWPLSQPAICVALDDDGNVYVGYEAMIEVYSDAGELLRSWGEEGKNRGELRVVTGMAIHGADLYVADAGNRCVHRFNLIGDFVDDIGKPDEALGVDGIVCPSPWLDVDVTADGRLFVTNPGRSRVEEYQSDGSPIAHWGEAGTTLYDFFGCCNPTNLALLPQGRIATAEKLASRVKVYDFDGKLLGRIASGFSEDRKTGLDLAVDSIGRILVVDPASGRVTIFKQVDGVEAP